MKTDQQSNRTRYVESIVQDEETFGCDLDAPGLTIWFDEADRALGDCLERIEHVAPDAVPHEALRTELLFLLRAARVDLLTRYLEATGAPKP